jgi:hypothetical protein
MADKNHDCFKDLTYLPTLAYECRAEIHAGRYRYALVVWLDSVDKPRMFKWELLRFVKRWSRIKKGAEAHCKVAQAAAIEAVRKEIVARYATAAYVPSEVFWKCY